MSRIQPEGIHAGIGPENYVLQQLSQLGIQVQDIKVHMSDWKSELIDSGDEAQQGRFAWIRRGMQPREKGKLSKREKQKRKELKKDLLRRTRRLEETA